MSPSPNGSTPAADLAAWAEVLSDLQDNAAAVGPDADEETVARVAAWQPPAGLGPLPPELADWAEKITATQAAAADHLRGVMADNRRHNQAVAAVPAARDTAASAYLDVEA